MILGITGGSGCGKTTLLRQIADAGGRILDCDEIYHRLLETDAALLHAIEARFPGTVVAGKLNRKALGAIVFSDPQALDDLNRITHSAVRAEVLRLLSDAPQLAAIDAIELFAGNQARRCQTTLAVLAKPEIRAERIMRRDGISREYALLRIQAQRPDSYFEGLCDHILRNDGSPEEFEMECKKLFKEILNHG